MPIIPGPNQKLPGTRYAICEHGKCAKKDSDKDPLKKHCVSEKCEPNTHDEHKCHCRAFEWIPEREEWGERGTGDFEDNDNILCFCVRLPYGD
jgi:hypothetical protein